MKTPKGILTSKLWRQQRLETLAGAAADRDARAVFEDDDAVALPPADAEPAREREGDGRVDHRG